MNYPSVTNLLNLLCIEEGVMPVVGHWGREVEGQTADRVTHCYTQIPDVSASTQAPRVLM